MTTKLISLSLTTAIATLGIAFGAKADTTPARCDVYPAGSDQATSYGPCTFSQRQGYVTITLEDGTEYELEPSSTDPYTYRDQDGRQATVEDGLGEAGLIYRLADVSIFVYWDGADTGSGTSTAYSEPRRGGGYVPCSIVAPTYDETCEANTVFGDPGNSSLTLIGVTGNEHHLAVYNGEMHSTDPNDSVLTQYLDGQYLININDEEFFKLDEIIVTGVD
jgi:hypothetical protein